MFENFKRHNKNNRTITKNRKGSFNLGDGDFNFQKTLKEKSLEFKLPNSDFSDLDKHDDIFIKDIAFKIKPKKKHSKRNKDKEKGLT